MTTVPWHTTRLIANGVTRILQLRRTRGSSRALYSLVQKAMLLPILRRCVYLCVGDVFRLRLAHSKSTLKGLKSLVVRQATIQDLPALADYYGDRKLIEARFERGDLCIVTLCQGNIGAAVWLAVGPGEFREDWKEMRCICRFPAGIAWSYDGRGTKMGAWGTLMARLPDFLNDLGVTELVAVIQCNNWKSYDAHKSLGYKKIGIVGCVGLFGILRCLCGASNGRWRLPPVILDKIEIVGRQAATQGDHRVRSRIRRTRASRLGIWSKLAWLSRKAG